MIKLVPELPPVAREWRNLPGIMRTCRQHRLISKESQEEWMDRQRQDQTTYMLGIEIHGQIRGQCGLTSITGLPHATAEYSLLIDPNYWKKGYGTEALKLLITHGFMDLGIETIWGEIFEFNAAGRRVAEKVGFEIEGKLRNRYYKEGRRIDSFMVSMTRDQWLKQS